MSTKPDILPDYGPLNAVKEDLLVASGDEGALQRQLNRLMTLLTEELESRIAMKGKCEECGRSAISDRDIIAGLRSVQGALSLRLAGNRGERGGREMPLEEMVRRLDGGMA